MKSLQFLLTCAVALLVQNSHAQPVGVFVEALEAGRASAPLDTGGPLRPAVAAIEAVTGKKGGIQTVAWRIQRFSQQSNCGRVGFTVYQEPADTAFPELGGELNICADGTPPLRQCPRTGLVPHSAKCPDGTTPQDTAEVKDAIAAAMSRGGLTHAQAVQRAKEARGAKK